jgi:hypothetical protein
MANESDSAARPKRRAPATSRSNTAATEQASGADGSQPGPAYEQPLPPAPSTEDLERLRTRLAAKYHGRRR